MTTDPPPSPPVPASPPSLRWNLFARELEDILATRGVRLSQIRYQAEIHQMKVRRLLQSLERPKSFPTLNREELQRVVTHYTLTADEQLRLRAAILATAVEALLMDRLDGGGDALHAAEQILPTLVAALQEHAGEPDGVGTFRRGSGVMTMESPNATDEAELDRALEPALDAIDRATLALHLSLNVAAATERLERARQALDAFQLALDDLADLSAYRHTEAWLEWHTEAESGHRAATKRLADLGG